VNPDPQTDKRSVASFRTKLAAAMMVVVAVMTGLGLYFAQRNVATNVERSLQQDFQGQLSALDKLQELRHAALAERCRALASKPRIHAALEDNALDLLYPSAKDELRDLMEGGEPAPEQSAQSLHARFYRFLDETGSVLPPSKPQEVGKLDEQAEATLALSHLPQIQQIGYVRERNNRSDSTIDEIIAIPIFSSDTGEVISALVVGFKPFELAGNGARSGMKSGIWVDGRVHMASLSDSAEAALALEMHNAAAQSDRAQSNFIVHVNGAPQLLFYRRLNPGSLFPQAYEVCIYPLADSVAHQHRLRWQIGGAGILLLLGGFFVSHFTAVRLSAPVEKLAMDSEMNRAHRRRAEAALVSTSEELKRSTRYSADASHQLKTPVTVLRAGLEGLLTREDFKPEVYEELSALLHQTHRLTGVIEDLLLLSRMDAGHLRIDARAVNLSQLVDQWLDDFGALSAGREIKIEREIPAELYVTGEERYTSLIVQNLLENARKYNRPGGWIRASARHENEKVVLRISNSGSPIPRSAQEHIFKRFHRDSTRSAISGHGLGLNLARELARLHGGDLRLVRSENDSTEFEVRFRASRVTSDRGSLS
jgi:signal transduction histidine kinase